MNHADGIRMGSRHRSRSLLLALTLAASVLTVVAPRPAAADHDRPTIEVTGHGFGHGWGLSQYGAYGYAIDFDWTSEEILDHYYGNTSAGVVPASTVIDPTAIQVDLRSDRGAHAAAMVIDGTVQLSRASTGDPAGAWTDQAVRLVINEAKTGFYVDVAASCDALEAGSWSRVAEIGNETRIRMTVRDNAAGRDGLLANCRSDGREVWYPGEIHAVNYGGLPRTVNVVALEDYLRGVVPKEVPASWAGVDEFGPYNNGMEALEAQSVAARSYVMDPDVRYTNTFADTCDTTLCQVYGGWYETPTANNPDGVVFDQRTDLAIAATAGVVRLRDDNGAIARTFFSSSTGGHTNPIDPFPGVVDLGDAVAANPNHVWTREIDLSAVEDGAGLGQLLDIVVTARNGLDGPWDDGGRVEQVQALFTGGAKTYSGSEFRRLFGLKSDWFSFGPLLRGGVPTATSAFVSNAVEVFLGREPLPSEVVSWIQQVNVEGKRAFLTDLVNSDEWAGTLVDGLYRDVLGRGADPDGREYWRQTMADGYSFEGVGTSFYSSLEYYNSVGGTDADYVHSLYERILGRTADESGFAYWTEILTTRGTITDVAASFYASPESRRQRADNLFVAILGRNGDTESIIFWGEQLSWLTDLELAVELALTEEFSNRR